MNDNYKILTYIDDIIESYNEPIEIVSGLLRNPKEIIRTIEFYTNDKYLSGNTDALGREKPFFQICNFRVTVAKTATDIDLKDLRYEPDSLKDAVPAMIINHEMYKTLKEMDFSETLNDMGKTRPKYGGLLLKKAEYNGELEIDVCEWTNVDFNPSDVAGGIIIEKHLLQPSELSEKVEAGWMNVNEFMKAHAKANRNKPKALEVKEVTGEFDYTFDPDIEDSEGNEMKFKKMCFYIGIVNKKKFLLYKEDLSPEEDKYKYLPWEKVKLGLGRGIVEEGFESQWATNDSILSIKNAMELSGKVILSTDSQKISGNALTGIDNGHIFQIEPGRSLTSVNLSPTAMPEYHNIIELWKQQYDNSVSVHDANTGEAPTAGTPYSQTALLNQVANSPFEYQREVWGIFLNEVLNDWILPFVKKRILKPHYLVSEFTDEELAIIDEDIKNINALEYAKKELLDNNIFTQEGVDNVTNNVTDSLAKQKNKREIKIPKGYLDIEGRMTANITGELKNKQAVLASLAQIGKDISATYNPQTGQFGAMQDPFLRKLYGSIINLAGTPMTSSDLKPTNTTPMAQPDQSSISQQPTPSPVSVAQPALAG